MINATAEKAIDMIEMIRVMMLRLIKNPF